MNMCRQVNGDKRRRWRSVILFKLGPNHRICEDISIVCGPTVIFAVRKKMTFTICTSEVPRKSLYLDPVVTFALLSICLASWSRTE